MPETSPASAQETEEASRAPRDPLSKMRDCLSPVKDRKTERKGLTVAQIAEKAQEIARFYGGECISKEKLSIVKGEKAFKFKC